MRARYPIEYMPFDGVGSDSYGNAIESWDDPETRMVYGVNYPASDEPTEAGHNRLVVDATLLVPANFVANERDRVRLLRDGKTYEVIGTPETAEGNPFRWNPGGRLNLRRVDG